MEYSTARISLFLLALNLMTSACQESKDSQFGSGGDEIDEVGSGNDEFTTASLDGVSLQLNDEQTIAISSAELSDLTGSLTVSIERDELDSGSVLAGDDLEISISPTSIDGPSDLTLTISTNWQAPSFNSTESNGPGEFNIVFTETGTSNVQKIITVPLQVQPILEIEILGYNGTAYEYSLPNSFTTPLCIRSHSNGLSLRFLNLDPEEIARTVHGEGLIPHGGSTAAGATYSVSIASAATSGMGVYYLHDASPADQSRRLRFNSSSSERSNPASCVQPDTNN